MRSGWSAIVIARGSPTAQPMLPAVDSDSSTPMGPSSDTAAGQSPSTNRSCSVGHGSVISASRGTTWTAGDAAIGDDSDPTVKSGSPTASPSGAGRLALMSVSAPSSAPHTSDSPGSRSVVAPFGGPVTGYPRDTEVRFRSLDESPATARCSSAVAVAANTAGAAASSAATASVTTPSSTA